MKLKAVIFDLDGTLLDTLEDITISVNYVLKQFSKPPIPIDDYRSLVGEGAYKLMQNVLPDADDTMIKKALVLFEEHYATQYDKNTKAYEGISKLLSFLQKNGVKMAILSNKPNAFTKKCAIKYLRKWHFEGVYGIRENIKRKPAGDGVVAILKELNLSPAECLFIGDTKIDMMTAKNAGMQSMGVLWGFRDEEELLHHGATYIASSPAEAIKMVQRIK